MSTRVVHVCLSVRRALLWPKRRLTGLLRGEDGRGLSADAVRAALMNELAKGHEVLPMCSCPDFDYRTGCPRNGGHR